MHSIQTEFPEAFYIPAKDNLADFLVKTDIGFAKAARSSCYIISLMRDCESVAKFNLARLDRLASYFNEAAIHVYENDSKDNTPEIIQKWRHERSFTYSKTPINKSGVSEVLGQIRGDQDYSLARRERMAECRNKCLDYVQKDDINWYNYIIMYDGDIDGGFSYHGVMNSLGYDGWNAIGSNSIIYRKNPDNAISRLYYDTWATRLMDDDGEKFYSQEKAERLNKMRWERGEKPFEVLSCFGGLAIYKTPDIIPLRYKSHDIDHMTIHEQMRANGGKIFLNPSMITLYNSSFYMGNDV